MNTKFRTIAAFFSLDSDPTNDMFINIYSFLRKRGDTLGLIWVLARYKHSNLNGWHNVVILQQKVKPNNHGDKMSLI